MLVALAPVARFQIQSQVLYGVPAGFPDAPWSADHSAYVVPSSQLPNFIDQGWDLDAPFDFVDGDGGGCSTGTGGSSSDSDGRQGYHSRGAGDVTGKRSPGGAGTGGGDAATRSAADASCEAVAAAARHVGSRLLHLVAYVPPPGQRPLRFQILSQGGVALVSSAGSGTATETPVSRIAAGNTAGQAALDGTFEGFWVPSWGAVTAMNPWDGSENSTSVEASSISGATTDAAGAAPPAHAAASDAGLKPLSDAALRRFAAKVVAQLRQLTGCEGSLAFADPSMPLAVAVAPDSAVGSGGNAGSSSAAASTAGAGTNAAAVPIGARPLLMHLPASMAGFTDWEIDALLRQRSAASYAAAVDALRSLSTLATQLPKLEIPDVVALLVQRALAALRAADAHAVRGEYAAVGAATRAAATAAEAASSHPGVTAQPNVPDMHNLGVYMPFFFPASLAVVSGVAREAMCYAKKRREWTALQRQTQQPVVPAAAAAGTGPGQGID